MMTTKKSETREDQRRRLRLDAGCAFVDAEQWCRLATSTQTLLRADQRSAGLRGLLDPASGRQYLIEEERLYLRS